MPTRFAIHKITDNLEAANSVNQLISEAEQEHAKILILISGGSALNLAEELNKNFSLTETVAYRWGVVDERFVPLTSEDSNFGQLLDMGFLESSGHLTPPTPDNFSELDEAADTYNTELKAALEWATYSIGIFGVGEDGHTSGMKPMANEPQFTELFAGSKLAVGYEADDYKRVTSTMALIPYLSDVVLFVNGSKKLKVLNSFIREDAPYNKQPVQALKLSPEITIITDQKLEDA